MLLFLAAWLPVTAHCGLETFEFLPLDECCAEESAPDQRCENGCTVVEDGGLKTECANVLPVPPTAFVIVHDLARGTLMSLDPPERFFPLQSRYLPQFVIRTALPIRGPSFLS